MSLTKSHLRLLTATALIFLASLPWTWSLFYHRGKRILVDVYSGHDQSIPYTAAIIYLASVRRSAEMVRSLTLVAQNLHTGPRQWPIILFHTGDFDHAGPRSELLARLETSLSKVPDTAGSALQSVFISRIYFSKVHWSLPEGIPDNVTLVDPVQAGSWPGYHHMCAFFAANIFSHPALEGYTYYLRLDTDSFIEAPLCYDPFEVMHVRKRIYGYRAVGPDAPDATLGMWEFVDGYARSHPDIEKRLQMNGWKWPDGRDTLQKGARGLLSYYNNFEIVKLEAFRRPDVHRWLNELMRDPKRVYKYRWGDAPIRYATVNMFFNATQDTEFFCGMKYTHQFRLGDECTCVPL
ncbi:glycosyltransferase family 15 protein [Hydnum rufescens UP504]|uniref:Glycosyltransferase family 15 protein n=1 Tax=Hydnum rufescens UP504 TaxID=1448309 RepID=A0A9P6ALN7_9AGAM|nr:glycosyltransferase family 15 protein [Hydnum rufescens UP504]